MELDEDFIGAVGLVQFVDNAIKAINKGQILGGSTIFEKAFCAAIAPIFKLIIEVRSS